MTEPRVFVCLDCRIETHVFYVDHVNDNDVCATCGWLRSIDDPELRERLREFLEKDDVGV